MKSRRDRTRPVPQTTAHNRPYTQKRLIKMSYSSLRRKVNLSIGSFDTTATHGFRPIHILHKALKLSGCYFSSIGFSSFSPEINLLIKTLFVVHLKNGMSISRNLMYLNQGWFSDTLNIDLVVLSTYCLLPFVNGF